MPSRSEPFAPSLRSGWLGGRLRELREDRGLTIKYAASYLKVDYADVARLERGQQVCQFDQVAALLDLYGVFERVDRDHLLGLARCVFRLPRWQDDFVGPDLDVSMLDFLWLESVAQRIRCYGPVLVPDLLRTSEYVEAVVRRETTDVSARRLAWWVQAFRDRQQALDVDPVTEVQAVIGESVLRRPVGGSAETLPGQLEYLVKAADGDGMGLQVVRAEAGYVPGMDGWFTVFDLPARYPGLVACCGGGRGVAIHEGRAAEGYAAMFDQLWDAAVPEVESVSLISRLASDLAVVSTN